MGETLKILILDDDDGCAKNLIRLIGTSINSGKYKIEIERAENGEKAIEMFMKSKHKVLIIDIDLGINSKNGVVILKELYNISIDNYATYGDIEAIILTGGKHPDDTVKASMECARFFIDKNKAEELIDAIRALLEKQYLRKEVEKLKMKAASYQLAITALATALEKRDAYTKNHSEKVSLLAYNIYKTAIEKDLLGLGNIKGDDIEEKAEMIKMAGKLHDIGKIAIPAKILLKPAELLPAEKGLMNIHPTESWEIVEHMKTYNEEMTIVKYHHCWYEVESSNKRSYPDRDLADGDIPLSTWIISVADVFDAMTSKRAYRKKDNSFIDSFDVIHKGRYRVAGGVQFPHEAVYAFFLCDYVIEHIEKETERVAEEKGSDYNFEHSEVLSKKKENMSLIKEYFTKYRNYIEEEFERNDVLSMQKENMSLVKEYFTKYRSYIEEEMDNNRRQVNPNS